MISMILTCPTEKKKKRKERHKGFNVPRYGNHNVCHVTFSKCSNQLSVKTGPLSFEFLKRSYFRIIFKISFIINSNSNYFVMVIYMRVVEVIY